MTIFAADRQIQATRGGTSYLFESPPWADPDIPYRIVSADVFNPPSVRSNDRDLLTGVAPARDSEGPRPVRFVLDIATESDWLELDAFFAATGVGRDHELAWSFQGEWMYYGRFRGIGEPVFDENGSYVGFPVDFLATDPTRYTASQVTTTTENATIATGGRRPTRAWKMTLPGPCVNVELFYFTPGAYGDIQKKIAYLDTVPSGWSLVIDCHDGPRGGAYLLADGEEGPAFEDYVTGVLVDENDAPYAPIMPWTPGDVEVIVTTTSGSAVADFEWRAAG